MSDLPPEYKHYLAALVDLIRRTGAAEVQIRYSDEEKPDVWFAVAKYPSRKAIANVGGAGKSLRMKHLAETAAGLDPILAVYRLAERLVDGGMCTHCGRVTMLWESFQNPPHEPERGEFCFHIYDPELATFTIGCKQAAK